MRSSLSAVFVLFLFLSVQAASAQWVQVNGQGGNIRCVAGTGDTLFMGTDRGLVRSVNAGISWWAVGDSMKDLSVDALDVHGTYVIAEAAKTHNDSRLFLSTNSGETWKLTHLNNSIAYSEPAWLDATPAFARIGEVVIANWGQEMGGREVLISLDSGQTWNVKSIGGGTDNLVRIRSYGSTFFGWTYFGTFLQSKDSGASWSRVNGIFNGGVSDLLPCGHRLYVCSSTDTHISIDSGATWSTISNFGIVRMVCVGDTLIGATPYGHLMRLSSDSIWVPISTMQGVPVLASANNLFITNAGLYRSTDLGRTWSGVYTSMERDSSFYSRRTLTIDHNLIVASDGKISDDRGQTWRPIPKYGNAIKIGGEGVLYLLSDDSLVERSRDTGKTWRRIAPATPFAGFDFPYLAVQNDRLIFGIGPTIFLSTDQGDSWKLVDSTRDYIQSVAIQGNILCAGTHFSSSVGHPIALVSSDDGQHWLEIDKGLPMSNVVSLALMDRVVLAGTIDSGTVFLDNGVGWKRSLPDIGSVTAIHQAGKFLYAGIPPTGVYISRDTGRTWSSYGLNFWPNYSAYNSSDWMASDDSFLYAASMSGVWKRPLTDANPFFNSVPDLNGTSNQGLQIAAIAATDGELLAITSPMAEEAHLRCYDILGKPVGPEILLHLLVGEQNIKLPRLRGGNYLCRLDSGGETACCKLVIAK